MKFKIQDRSDVKRKELKEALACENDEYSESLSELLDIENVFLDYLIEHSDARNHLYSVNSDDFKVKIIKDIDDYLINLFSQIKFAYINCLKYIDSKIDFCY